jgi:hypothetical protein
VLRRIERERWRYNERMTEMKLTIPHVKDHMRWLFIELWFIWGTVASVLIPALFVWLCPLGDRDARCRWAGTVLQLVGLIATAYGIAETRRLFGRPSIFESAKAWLARRPKAKVAFMSGTGTISLTGGPAELSVGSTPAPAGSSTEERVAQLEQWISLMQQRTEKLEQRAREEIAQRKEADVAEQMTRAEADKKLGDKLELSATGGLKLSWVGVVCLTVGTALAGFGPDIARWGESILTAEPKTSVEWRVYWVGMFGVLYALIALLFSCFYGWKAIEILTDVDPKVIRGARLYHQRWLNFLGSVAGWICLWFVIKKISLAIWDGGELTGGWLELGLAIVGFVGVTGYLPYVVITIVDSIGKVIGHIPQLSKPGEARKVENKDAS